uniref:Uncharacterized protein n=1 Tax=viral metagenome TaxID=1070528 RepID=A0A6M3L5R3_9ZZZZ
MGQYIHDTFPHTFWFMDIDAIIYKKATKIMRIVERKKAEGELRFSQKFLLPILAVCISFLICFRYLNKQSGVFLVKTDKPFDIAIINRIKPALSLELDKDIRLSDSGLKAFLTAEEINE